MKYAMLLFSIGAVYSTTLANDDMTQSVVSALIQSATLEKGRQSWRQIQ
jgi:hypothetical protein